jgi:hypothetical protein
VRHLHSGIDKQRARTKQSLSLGAEQFKTLEEREVEYMKQQAWKNTVNCSNPWSNQGGGGASQQRGVNTKTLRRIGKKSLSGVLQKQKKNKKRRGKQGLWLVFGA